MLVLYEQKFLSEEQAKEILALEDAQYRPLNQEEIFCEEEACALLLLSSDTLQRPYASDRDFLQANKNVRRWIIVLLHADGAYAPAVKSWKRIAPGPAEVVAEAPGRPPVAEQVRLLLKREEKKCLVVSPLDCGGAREFTQMLCGGISHWKFENVSWESWPETAATASRFILYGQKIQDYLLEPVDIPVKGCLLAVLDCRPSDVYVFQRQGYCVKEVFARMRQKGWEIPVDFPNYAVTMRCYEKWRIKRENRQISEELQPYPLWDQYGLPERAENCGAERIGRFLEQFNSLQKIRIWLEA